MPDRLRPRRARGAIFLAALASLVVQIAVPRVLSASLAYHAAFVVIGVVMLGMSGASAVYFVRRAADPLGAPSRAVRWASVAAATCLAFGPAYSLATIAAKSLGPLPLLALVPAAFGVVFFGAGYVVTHLLTAHADDAGPVYWADLTGAAVGCLLVVPALDLVPPAAVIAGGGVAFAGAGLLLVAAPTRRAWAAFGVAVLTALAVAAFPSASRLHWAKYVDQDPVLWERWNRLSRVTVLPQIPGRSDSLTLLSARMGPAEAKAAMAQWELGWGISAPFDAPVPEMRWIEIDADAGTQILAQGPADVGEPLRFVAWDVTTIGYQIRPARERAFVIGGGGGRDILSALHFGATHVDVGELNPDVVRAVDDAFGDFSGRPYADPRVTLHLGDARNTLSRLTGPYDIVQMSMIDTWAASVGGSLVLSENALYTREAFGMYLDRLDEDGLLTVSRWAPDGRWGEVARTLSLMGAALTDAGVDQPENHVLIAIGGGTVFTRVVTSVLSRSPFTDAERDRFTEVVHARGHQVLWPAVEGPPPFDVPGVLRADPTLERALETDLTPPDDDRPFFFETRPPLRSLGWALAAGDPSRASLGARLIVALLGVYALFVWLLVIAPLRRFNESLPAASRVSATGQAPALVYFGGIGVGFLAVEVALLQRYVTFLGHPTYAMSVVLFALLLSSGLGASLSSRLRDGRAPVGALLVGILFTAFAVPALLAALQGLSLGARVAVAVALVVPLGVCMGTLFPLGVRRLSDAGRGPLLPWLWGVNGVAGVAASAACMLVAISQGHTAVLLVGTGAYLGSAIAAERSWGVTRTPPPAPPTRAASR